MGVSFKVSKIGRRYHPKPSENTVNYSAEDESLGDDIIASTKKDAKLAGDASEKKSITEISEADVSFTLSLFPEGYSVGKYAESDPASQAPIEIPKFLHPYNRASETFFSAIESGLLPGDILDEITCKFIDGTVVCQVRDYRKCFPEGPNAASGDVSPIVNVVRLRMSLENVVKDIPAISDNSWTYGDLMEMESRIVKVLQPQLLLDPSAKLVKLADNLGPAKLNFELRSMRRKRLRQIPEVVSSSNNIQGKRVFIDRVSENLRLGDSGSLMQQQPGFENMNSQTNISSTMLPQRNNSFGSDGSLLMSSLMSQQPKYQIGPGSPRLMKDQRSGVFSNAAVASPGGHEMVVPFPDNSAAAASFHGKRDQTDGQSSPLINKKPRLASTGVDGNPQHLGSHIDNLQRSDAQWKNTLLQQQAMARGIQFSNNGMQKFPQQIFDGAVTQEGSPMPFAMGQQGIRYNLKEEPIEMERVDRPEHSRMHMSQSDFGGNIDSHQPRVQQRMPPVFMRSGMSQPPWNNLVQPLDNNSRNEEKRKSVQSPRVSAGGLPQSPLSSKSGEFSSGSMGHQFGPVATSSFNQNDKSVVTSVPPVVVGNPSFTSSANESIQRQNQTQAAAKRRSNSLSKTPTMGGVGSPASVSNMSVPINASSPSIGNQPFGDHGMLEKFSKIEAVTVRFQLYRKKNKVDQLPIVKANKFSPQLVAAAVSDPNFDSSKDDTCEMPLSKSLLGGNMNVCKARVVNFVQQDRIYQGNNFHMVTKARTKMMMSEKPGDGAVAFHIGEIEEADYLAAEDYLPTLPNTDIADRLAAQFCSLMEREGFNVENSMVQPRPVIRTNPTSSNIPVIPPIGSPSAEVQQFQEASSIHQPNDFARPGMSVNASINTPQQNMQNQRVLHPVNAQQIQISQSQVSSSRPQQPEQQLPPMQQQQNPQFQRSPLMLPTNSLQQMNNMSQNANIQMSPNMTNKPSSLQLQLLQQQQQQQQIQRKMMSGLGSVSMGSIGNNMVGIGLNNAIGGIGGVRGAPGISGPMGPITGLGNVNQNNPINNLTAASNITNAFRSFSPAQAAFMKMKFGQRLGGPQSSITGMTGARQLHVGPSGLSVLGPTLSRANINQMQRAAMGQMGPPKMMPGMNVYPNQSQQQQLQQLQQQQQIPMLQQQQTIPMQQQQQQQQIQMQTQQETASPLQSAVSPPPVGSPSSMGVPNQPQPQQIQQQASPQQMGQRTPMSPQMSSGALQQMAAANPEACPASPQLSSQTMGSVGSITNSSMDLQGANKSNSVSNA